MQLVAASSSTCRESAGAAEAPVAPSGGGWPGDHAGTRCYAIAINYTTLAPGATALALALREHPSEATRQFMPALLDWRKFPEFAGHPPQWLVDYKLIRRNPTFISVRGQDMIDTGDAHPIPPDPAEGVRRGAEASL
ncbi:MAG: hypothetical protein ABI379_03580 [Rhodanobacter sp.]